MKPTIKKHSGFTLLELVFTIVILGILASLSMPNITRASTQEAKDGILSDIRYTQHLALIDNKHQLNTSKWQRTFWYIGFQKCNGTNGTEWFETISTNLNLKNNINKGEEALDPSNGLSMNVIGNSCKKTATISERILLTQKYGITNITSSCSKSNRYLGFDHLGRPHSTFLGSNVPNYKSYIKKDCAFTFTMSDETTFSIDIQAETGYVSYN